VTPATRSQTAAPVPADPTLDDLRQAAAGCQACDLWARATQTVFGEGEAGAAVMLVGEQPGDKEDLAGEPFVGPAGRMLDRALEAAGIARGQVYVTNVVKHFKWRPVGKRRIHQKPNAAEVSACRPWLEAELGVVRPQVVVCLGATAAQALLGRDAKVTRDRGQIRPWRDGVHAALTVHPSSILRAPDEADRAAAFEAFAADLAAVAGFLREKGFAGEGAG
jgi:uracil-DNA glycosylase family protein